MGLKRSSAGASAWLRLMAYVLSLNVVVALVVVAMARARSDATLLRLGKLVMDYAEATHQQAPRTVVLNGAQIQLSVGAAKRPVSAVLDHFQRRCKQHGGGLGAHLQDALTASGKAASLSMADPAMLDGIYRLDDDDRGVLACLDLGAPSIALEELSRRVQRVTLTGDLSALGQLRFVTVERGEQRTVFAAIWTEGPINVQDMFPRDGDAAGADAADIPRPVGARRVLSAWETGHDKAVYAYLATNGPLATVRRDYLALLRRVGFQLGDDTARADGAIVQHGERTFAISFSAFDEQGTWVTISSLDDATGAIRFR